MFVQCIPTTDHQMHGSATHVCIDRPSAIPEKLILAYAMTNQQGEGVEVYLRAARKAQLLEVDGKLSPGGP